jgi:hypothetical protein
MVIIHNGSQVSNGFGTVNLLLLPTGIMFLLFFVDGILKFKEKLFNGVNSIGGSGISHHHVINLSVEAGCVSIDADKCNKEKLSSHCFKWLWLVFSFLIINKIFV